MSTPFDQDRFVSLRTYRKDGTPVETPVWAAPLDGHLVVFTLRETAKVKRLRRNEKVQLAKCTSRGGLLGPWRDGRAWIVEDAARERAAYDALNAKYGLLMRGGTLLARLSGRAKRRVIVEIEIG